MYKEAKTFKGFEAWYNQLQMSLKMYVYTFLIVLLIHTIIPPLYLILFRPELLKAVSKVVLGLHFPLWPRAFTLLLREGFTIFIFATPVWLLYPALLARFKTKSQEIMTDQYLRGSKCVSDDELRKIVLNHIKQEKKRLPVPENLIHIGKIPVPPWAETRHFLVVGRPGTGKTTLLNQVLEVLRKRKSKVIIHDFKGDYLSTFYDPNTDIIFNPIDTRTINWCLFSEVEMQPDIDSIAASMIPESFREDRFWIDAARDVFASILYYLKTTKQESNRDIWKHVTLTEQEMIELMRAAVDQGVEYAKKAQGYLQGYEKGSKVASDVLSTMRQYTNCFQYMTHLESAFSIKKWLENDKASFVFITNYANVRDTLKPALSLFVDLTLKHLLSLPESHDRRVFFILDEFASLQRLSSVVRALEQGRSKGASVWIATQDIGQLQKLYGHETASTITNTCNTIVSFALNDPNSCEFMSKVFGETEILETDETFSMGPKNYRDGLNITRRRKIERVVLPSQFTILRDLECYLKLVSYDITKTRIQLKKLPRTTQELVLNERFRFS